MRVPALVPLALLLALATSTWAGTFDLNPATGSDTSPGTPASPWKTLAKVKRTAQPGDTINIQAGTYTPGQYQGETGRPFWWDTQALGRPGQPITIQAAPGASVVFEGRGQIYWQLFATRQGSYGGHYVVIKHLTFRHYAGAAVGIFGDPGPGPAHHVAVLGCRFADFSDNQTGALVTGRAHHILFQDNTITNMGDRTFGGQGLPNLQHSIYLSEGSQHIVIDGNRLEKSSGYGIHAFGHGKHDQPSGPLLIRRNAIVNIHAAGIILAGTTYRDVYVVHNTLYNEPRPFPARNNQDGLAGLAWRFRTPINGLQVRNNIGDGVWRGTAVLRDGGPALAPLGFMHNLWRNRTSAARTLEWDGGTYRLPAFQAATGLEQGSKSGDPLFGNAAGRDFSLRAGSQAIDAGGFLTTTVGAGSGTLLRVADAGFFMDGFGLVGGDVIQVGSQPPVQLVAINHEANTLTLAQPLTWQAGDGVALPYAGTAPDMGAYESGSVGQPAEPPPPPRNLRLIAQ